MQLFDSRQTLYVIAAVAAGLLAGQSQWIAENTIHLVVPAMVAML